MAFFERDLSEISTVWGVLRSWFVHGRGLRGASGRKGFLQGDILHLHGGNVPSIAKGSGGIQWLAVRSQIETQQNGVNFLEQADISLKV